MKKKISVIVIIGIIFSVIGLAMATFSAVFAYQDYKNYSKFNTGVLELKEELDYSFNFDAGKITVLYSDEEYSYIDYKITEFYEIKNENKNVTVTTKYKFLFPIFGNKNEIKVYLSNTNTKNMSFTLNAGVLDFSGIHQFNELKVELNAGKINIDGIKSDKLNLSVNAGELIMKDGEVNNLNLEVNAGDLNVKSLFDSLNFTVNAGNLDLTTYKTKDDYNIKIERNAGSSNVSNGGTGARTIKGEVNAGNVDIKFTGTEKTLF